MVEEGTKGQKPIIVVEKSSTKASLEKSYDSRDATIIGVIHILCGIAASFSTLLLLSPEGHVGGFVLPGIWCSVFFIISGSLSICSGKNTTSCLIISTMVMSIFSAISAGVLIIFSTIVLLLKHAMKSRHYEVEVYLYIQLLAGIIELVVAITSAILSCMATCCRDKKNRDTTTPYKVVYKTDSDLDHQKIVSHALNIEHSDQELLLEEQEHHGKSFAYNRFS